MFTVIIIYFQQNFKYFQSTFSKLKINEIAIKEISTKRFIIIIYHSFSAGYYNKIEYQHFVSYSEKLSRNTFMLSNLTDH